MAIALNVSNSAYETGTNVANATVSLVTTVANCLIRLVLVCNAQSTSDPVPTIAVSDTSTLTWAHRAQVVRSAFTSQGVQEWWAWASSAISTTITVAFNTYDANYYALSASAWSGINSSTPWDSNGSLPGTSGTTSTTIITSNANDVLFGAMACGSASPSAPSGWTALFNVANYYFLDMYQIVSATQSGTAVNDSAADAIVTIGDAAQAAIASAYSPYNPWPQQGPILAQRALSRRPIGWVPPNHERRRRALLTPTRGLLVPHHRIVKPLSLKKAA
jgi:hypothetical protein